MKVAVGFNNGLGNLLFLSVAIKVLRNWGYNDVTAITDDFPPRNYQFIQDVGSHIFDNIVTRFDEGIYDKILVAGWSVPNALKLYMEAHNNCGVRTVNWKKTGIHEVQVYLNMIGATWHDFDGYILPVADGPKLPKRDKIRIALANPSNSGQAKKKAWDKFPQLVRALRRLGFEVVLLGWKTELTGCECDFDYREKLSIYESARVLKQCDLLIAASTALTVIADAVKTPVILLEGPMDTHRAHPIQSKYTVVRKFISCAPCMQLPIWNICKNPLCMKNIQVGDVLKKLYQFLPNRKQKARTVCIGDVIPKNTLASVSLPKVDKKIAYMVSCFGRFNLFDAFMTSFEKSNPLPGKLYIWNDGSLDPRIKARIDAFNVDGIEVKYFETPHHIEKADECKIASTRVSNLLFDKVRVDDKKYKFDYVVYMDSDIVFKPDWLQRLILMFEHAEKEHTLCCVTGLNNKHDYFNVDARDDTMRETPYGNYRIRGGMCIHFVMPMHIVRGVLGRYSQSAGSSDISKSEELLEKGYRSMVAIPSLVQHIGATESSFRHVVGVIAEDY